MINEIIIPLAIGSIILILGSIMIILKIKKLESDAGHVLNLFVVCLVLQMALVAYDGLNYLVAIGIKIAYMDLISNLMVFAVMPLFLVFFIGGIFILREH